MRVYTIDDDAAVLRSSAAWLRAHGFDAVACPTAQDFLDRYQPDVPACALVDIRMPGMTGLELQQHLARQGHEIPLILITGHGDVPMAVQAIKAGAIDFIEKPADEEKLLAALAEARRILDDGTRRTVPRNIVRERLARLTTREREVLDHLVLGRINKQIAETLGISQRTVEIHRARIREKMEARGVSDLIMMMR